MNRREFLKTTGLSSIGFPAIHQRVPGRAASRPNILLALADDISHPHMGAYGCSWIRTPGFDRVAKEGVLFNRCYTPNAKCAPSRACLLTGRNSWQLEEAANHWCYFPGKFKTYAETLAEQGYHAGFTAKGWGPGVAGETGGKARQLAGTAFSEKRKQPPTSGMAAFDYVENFRSFLGARPKEKPFCFWYGALEPHRGFEFRSGAEKGGKRIEEIERVFSFWPDNETVRHDLLDYALEVEYFDQQLTGMLQILEHSGELDNTLVVVTADNGMAFPRVKGQVYEYSNHMPMAMMWSEGIRGSGRTIDDYVSFIDLAPTFLELAEVDPQRCGMEPITGRSLKPILSTSDSGRIEKSRDHVLLGKERHDVGRPNDWGYPVRAILREGMLYIHNFETDRWPSGNPETGYLNCDGSPTKTECLKARRAAENQMYWELCFGKRPQEELYNVGQDPDCITNLAAEPAHAGLKEDLKTSLFRELEQQNDPRMSGQGHIFDRYPYADPTGRNFYERYRRGEKMRAGWVNPEDFEEGIR
jgi:N-sulfoglucosamine sulfohydrolase